jgi:hypothetical protein
MNPASSIDSDHVYGKIQVQPRHHSPRPRQQLLDHTNQKKQRLSVRIPNRCHEVLGGLCELSEIVRTDIETDVVPEN